MPQQFAQNPFNQFESEKLSVGWPWRLFLLSFFVLLATFSFYVGLRFGYNPYLNSKIEEKKSELKALGVSEREKEILGEASSLLENLRGLLSDHVFASKLFPFLEKITNQKVYFENADINIAGKEVVLSGITESFSVLAEQLEAFNQAEGIERYSVADVEANGNIVNFRVTLKLKSDLLK